MWCRAARFRRVRDAMDQVNTTVQDFLRGIRLIRRLGTGGVGDPLFSGV